MRLTLLTRPRPDATGTEPGWDIGAAVVRALAGGEVSLELGPADGPPQIRLVLTTAEAMRLSSTVRGIVTNGGESVLMGDV